MADYAGESLAKKVARVRLYKRTLQALKLRLPHMRGMKAIFLIGDEASEVGALKHILGIEPENMIGIDREERACEALSRKEPDANPVLGDLNSEDVFKMVSFLLRGDGAAFVHLDLMGNLSRFAEVSYGNWGQFCCPGGVMAVTYLRGRESKHTKTLHPLYNEHTELMLDALAKTSEGKKLLKIIAPDPKKAFSHLNAINMMRNSNIFIGQHSSVDEAIAAFNELSPEEWMKYWDDYGYQHGLFTPIASYAYRSEVSPMGVLAVQCVKPQIINSDFYSKFRYSGGRLVSSVIRKDPMDDLLAEADSLEKNFTKQQVAEILDVSPGTLAAWRAHRTMGTYA